MVSAAPASWHPIVFGPVPSRRLGRSLGVSTIPPKVCSYSCRYCQLGHTTEHVTSRRAFAPSDQILEAVRERAEDLRRQGERIDYVSLVPDGEPTLDIGLGRCIDAIKSLGLPVAVISNASLMSREDVRGELGRADWVSLKVDATRERTWRSLDRPRRDLALAGILAGALEFRASYRGRLATETMMVAGANDSHQDMESVAEFLVRLRPSVSYLSVPIRPPADGTVRAAGEAEVARLHAMLISQGQPVELLIASEGDSFSSTGNAAADILAITSAHPMRHEAVASLLDRSEAGWEVVQQLLETGDLVRTDYEGDSYYVRSFRGRRTSTSHSTGGT